MWELIASCKAGRCVVLTTHSMEEAEVLGDRIAIMAAGQSWGWALHCMHAEASWCLSHGMHEVRASHRHHGRRPVLGLGALLLHAGALGGI